MKMSCGQFNLFPNLLCCGVLICHALVHTSITSATIATTTATTTATIATTTSSTTTAITTTTTTTYYYYYCCYYYYYCYYSWAPLSRAGCPVQITQPEAIREQNPQPEAIPDYVLYQHRVCVRAEQSVARDGALYKHVRQTTSFLQDQRVDGQNSSTQTLLAALLAPRGEIDPSLKSPPSQPE